MVQQIAAERVMMVAGKGNMGLTQEVLRTVALEDLKRRVSLYRALICETKQELETQRFVANREKSAMAAVLEDAVKIFDRFPDGTEEAAMSARIGAVLTEVGR